MCNLYSMTKTQDAMRQIFRFKQDRAGNLPPLPGIFPDMMGPVIRKGQDGDRELVMARWGMPLRRRDAARSFASRMPPAKWRTCMGVLRKARRMARPMHSL
jgi:putative SOS response-associated peptidase YedK